MSIYIQPLSNIYISLYLCHIFSMKNRANAARKKKKNKTENHVSIRTKGHNNLVISKLTWLTSIHPSCNSLKDNFLREAYLGLISQSQILLLYPSLPHSILCNVTFHFFLVCQYPHQIANPISNLKQRPCLSYFLQHLQDPGHCLNHR